MTRALQIHRLQRYRTFVVVVWCAVVAIAAYVAADLPNVVTGVSSGIPGSRSVDTIERTVDAGIPASTFFPFLVLLKSARLGVFDQGFESEAQAVATALVDIAAGGTVRSYWNTGRVDLLGKDRHSALIIFRPNVPRFDDAEALTAQVRGAVRRAGRRDDFEVIVTGTPAMYFDLDRQSSADLLRAERVGVPVTLLILLVAFGAPVAAGLPVLMALAAIVVSSAVLFALSGWMPVSVFSQNVVSMIGLGVGVDYALFAVSSFRRHLARGLTASAAAAAATLDTRHTILVSGVTVGIGFSALLLVNVPVLRAMAIGGMVVVLTASVASLTLLPALLSWFGNAVNWPRRRQPGGAGNVFWSRWAASVMEHRWACLAAGIAVLAVFLIPLSRLQAWSVGVDNLVPELEARQGYDLLADSFEPGAIGPTVIAVELPQGSSVWQRDFQHAVAALSTRLLDDVRVSSVTGFPDVVAVANRTRGVVRSSSDLPEKLQGVAGDFVSHDNRTALIVVLPTGAPESREAMSLVDELRRDEFPELASFHARVGISGTTALTQDFDREVFGRMPIVVAAVLAVTFVVLFVSFRSVLVPIKAILLNVLSVLASYGFLVYVFQDGHGAALINLSPPGGLNSFIVLVLFTVLFGLSMDYHVFLLSAVRDAYVRTGETEAAVAEGLRQTAGPISSAAMVMVSIFASFGFTRLVATRELGLGLAFAVALDATLVRLVLVPASMAVLGSLNWWTPAWRRVLFPPLPHAPRQSGR